METTAKPVRIQLSRKKGWRLPENTVKVDRSTQWGNPFVIGQTYPIKEDDGFGDVIGQHTVKDAADAVALFSEHMEATGWTYDLESLRGKNLACWCKPGEPCHADVLLELANQEPNHES